MRKTISVVFVCPAIQFAKRNSAVGDELEKKGVKVNYISYSREALNYLRKKGKECTYIIKEMKGYKLRKSLDKCLVNFEEKYDTSMEMILFSDFEHSRLMKRKKALTILVKHFIFWENYLKKNRIDFMIGGTERFINMVPRIVGKKFNMRHIIWNLNPIANTVLLTEDMGGHFDKLDKYWKKNKNRKLTKKELKRVMGYIKPTIKEKKGATLVDGVPRITIKQVSFFLKRYFSNMFIEKFQNPYAHPYWLAKHKAKKAIRKYVSKLLYSKPNYKEKYFFYPLHMEEDAQLTVIATQYSDQYFLLKYISSLLPAGYKLYIKEHPNNIGGTKISKLKKILKLPNVKLISPYVNSHDLIRNAACMITINSTVGFEAILYGKPVICFGTVFYDIAGLTWNVSDLYDLPEIMKKVLKKNIWSKEKMLRFVNSILQTMRPGNRNFYEGFEKEAFKKENLSLLADQIYEELKQRTKTKTS